MKYIKNNNKFEITVESNDEEIFMAAILSLISGNEESFLKSSSKLYTTCDRHKIEKSELLMKCGLPIDHKGNRHATILTWKTD